MVIKLIHRSTLVAVSMFSVLELVCGPFIIWLALMPREAVIQNMLTTFNQTNKSPSWASTSPSKGIPIYPYPCVGHHWSSKRHGLSPQMLVLYRRVLMHEGRLRYISQEIYNNVGQSPFFNS